MSSRPDRHAGGLIQGLLQHLILRCPIGFEDPFARDSQCMGESCRNPPFGLCGQGPSPDFIWAPRFWGLP